MRHIIYLHIFLFQLILLSPLNGLSVSGVTDYPAFCRKAAEDDSVFENFKRNSTYQVILEHVSYELGLQYLECINSKYPYLNTYLDDFRQNDELGNPVTYFYGECGFFSPTTLRYIKTAGDLREKFGDLDQMHIVEIGGGYGGLCTILSHLGFASYTLIDLPESILLAKKYLEKLGISNVRFVESSDLSQLGSYDLVISNYAFSEVDKSEQLDYLKKILKPTPNGYMIMNFISNCANISSFSLEELLSFLQSSHKSIEIEKETPLTHPDNEVIAWKSF